MQSSTNASGSGEYPRPQEPYLKRADLQPADILLSRGAGKISDMIVAADRGSYSHAALWSGDKIIESTLNGGIAEQAPSGVRYVYRYRDIQAAPEAQALSPQKAAHVIELARAQVGNKYDTAEIHLLAVVFQKWWPMGQPRRSLATALLDVLGGGAGRALKDWLQKVYARSAPRICTELVALCFYEAKTPIWIKPLNERPAAPQPPASPPEPEEAAALSELEVSVKQALFEDSAAVSQVATTLGVGEQEARGALLGEVALDTGSGNPVGIVTPGDLQFSPSLQFVGILDSSKL